ncbi:MAG: helix-turn-helix domain-containing protein, partial [Defluviitaleaceae bacterium]|nr:helix-turn-helix domain-containing protein [Defluviitaleaceae bacterium]
AYLGRIFSHYVGESFIKRLERVRVEKGRQLITDSRLKICSISETVGFASVDYFCKRFKYYIGTTPKEYRENLHKENPGI